MLLEKKNKKKKNFGSDVTYNSGGMEVFRLISG